jgi:cation diffusion facilitator CzcD-associated flavoprotein CzcO
MIWLFKYVHFFLLVCRCWQFIKLKSRYPQFQYNAAGERVRKKTIGNCHKHTKAAAPEKYWGLLLPEYEGACKRIIADFGYLASLNAPNLQLLQDPAMACDRTGVLAQSGKHYVADVIVSTIQV